MFQRVIASNAPNAPRVAGDVQCKFCLAKEKCVEYSRWSGALIPASDSVPMVRDARRLAFQTPMEQWTPEQCAVVAEILAPAQKTLDARLLADAKGVVNNRAYYFTSRDFATRHTDVLRIAIEEINTIEQWISKNKPAAAVELSAVLGLDKSITELFLNRVAYGAAPVTRDILAEQQSIADTFFDLKLIPRKLNLLHAAPVDL